MFVIASEGQLEMRLESYYLLNFDINTIVVLCGVVIAVIVVYERQRTSGCRMWREKSSIGCRTARTLNMVEHHEFC